MSGQVPVLSIVFMAFSCAFAFALPIGLFLYLQKRKGADTLPFFIGCAVFVLFALILEGRINNFLLLRTGAGSAIRGRLWAYALYAGGMAALFEEFGRFLAFRTVLKKARDRNINALMYGAGHGGIEAALLLGAAHINNIIYSVMNNLGQRDILTASLSGEVLEQVEAGFTTLITTPSWQFLMGAVERAFAVPLQIALSVLVWFAAKQRNKRWLLLLAIFFHCFVDAAVVLLSGKGCHLLLLEALIGLFTLAVCLCALRVWRANRSPVETGSTQPEGSSPSQGKDVQIQ